MLENNINQINQIIETPSKLNIDRVKQAKLQKTAEKIASAANLREKWKNEKQERIKLAEKKRKAEIAERKRRSELLSQQRLKNIQKRQQFQEALKEEKRQNLMLKNKANAESAKKIEDDMKLRRRQSIMLNKTIMNRAKERKLMLKVAEDKMKESRQVLKQLDMESMKKAKQKEDDLRRQSMAHRTTVAKIHKQKDLQKKLIEKDEINSIFQFRSKASKALKETKDDEMKRKRQSVAHRLEQWKKDKAIMTTINEQEKDKEYEELQLKRENWLALKDHEKIEQEKERKSLEGRLQAWRNQKEDDKLKKQEEEEIKKIEKELADQARDDIQQYRKQQHQTRRASLVGRIDKAKSDKDWERGQATLLALAMEDERLSAEEDRKAIEEYKKNEQESRKQSLLNHTIREHQEEKAFKEELELSIIEEDKINKEFNANDRDDVEAYNEEIKRKNRESLAKRLVVATKQHEMDIAQHCTLLADMHADFSLKRAASKDVEAYKQQQKEDRRKSMAMRIDSWRKSKISEEKRRQKLALLEEEDRRLRELDRQDMELAQQMMKDDAMLQHMITQMSF